MTSWTYEDITQGGLVLVTCEVQRSLIVFKDKVTNHILLHFIQSNVLCQDRQTDALGPSQYTLLHETIVR